MDREELITRVLRDFSFIPKNIPGIFLYGSYSNGTAQERSDIDICLVAGPEFNPYELQTKSWRCIGSGRYDIRIFELLPLFIQIRIITTGILIYSPDTPALYEYPYQVRKRWDDQRWYQTPIPGA